MVGFDHLFRNTFGAMDSFNPVKDYMSICSGSSPITPRLPVAFFFSAEFECFLPFRLQPGPDNLISLDRRLLPSVFFPT